MQTFNVFGLIVSPLFQKCREATEHISQRCKADFRVVLNEEVPRDYYERRAAWIAQGVLPEGSEAEVVVVDDKNSIMLGDEFLVLAQRQTDFRVLSIDPASLESYEKRALLCWRTFLRERGNTYCWMDVQIGDEPIGRITFELYSKQVPRTSNNFWRLCRGKDGDVVPEGESDPVQLSYKGSTFFRVLKGAWVMGGDISKGHTGNGGYSCYGRYFPDESFAIPHSGSGILGMCNDGAHTNASSFYITRKRMSWMDKNYVAFGRVIDGMPVVDAIHDTEVKHNQAPRQTITIVNCGIIDTSM